MWIGPLISALLVYAYLPFALMFGLATLDVTGMSSGLLLSFGGFLVGVHLILATPVVSLVAPELRERAIPFGLRVLVMVALASPPLIAFSYFIGGVKEVMDLHEILLIVFPTTVISALYFEHFKKGWVFTLGIFLLSFPHLFLVNDILSPFRMPIYYYSKVGAFYFWRTVFPVVAVWFSILWICFERKKAKIEEPLVDRFRTFAYCLLGLAFYTLIVKFVIPVSVSVSEGLPPSTHIMWDFWWVAHLLGCYFLLRPGKVGYYFLLAMSAVEIIIVLSKFMMFFANLEPTYWRLSWFTNKTFVLGIFIWLLVLLLRPPVRLCFLKK